jgi:hypothetical protein
MLVALGSGIAVALSSPAGANTRGDSPTEVRASRAIDVPGFLYPGGRAKPVRVTLRNRSGHAIRITRVSVAVRATGASGCRASWFRIRPARSKRGLLLRARQQVTLPERGMRAPTIRMLESGTNQDACQGARLTLVYRAKTRPKRAPVALAGAEREDRWEGLTSLLALPIAAVILLGARMLAGRR